MELIVWMAVAAAYFWAKRTDQQQRIALLGSVLSRYDIEKLMESLTDGYLRALGEEEAERQAQVWSYLEVQEQTLSSLPPLLPSFPPRTRRRPASAVCPLPSPTRHAGGRRPVSMRARRLPCTRAGSLPWWRTAPARMPSAKPSPCPPSCF
jgi:hypothetical protein